MKRSFGGFGVPAAAAVAGLLAVVFVARAVDPKTPPAGPFDLKDPDIQALRALKWSDIDFNAQPLRQRCAALIAMKQMASRIGGKADAQLDLLVAYIDQQKLGEQFAGHLADLPDLPGLSYEDAEKLAMAFVLSPMGKDKFGDDLEGCDDATLHAYQKLYEKSARVALDETVESRHEVREMATFLQKEGKFNEFVEWAKVEQQKRQEAFEQDLKRRKQEYAQVQKQKQEEAQLAYAQEQERQRAAREEASRQMEAAGDLQGPSGGAEAAAPEGSWGWSNVSEYWPWTGAYYANNRYRGEVRDRVNDAYQNWNGNRVQPLRGAGGGRGGGRR